VPAYAGYCGKDANELRTLLIYGIQQEGPCRKGFVAEWEAVSPPVDSICALLLVWRIIGKIIRTALCCVVYGSCVQWYAHTCEQFLQFCTPGLDFFLCVYLGFVFCVFYVSLGHFVLLLLGFVVLGLVSSVRSQEIGWEERLRNDLLCAEWDVKP